MLTLTQTLLLWLLGAAFVGLIIGWFCHRIAAIGSLKKLTAKNTSRMQLMNDEVTALREEDTRKEEELVKTRAMISSYEKAAKESVKQANDFANTIKRKEQRVAELESQVLASEEQHMRVQRDFAKLRLTKTREVQQLRQQLSNSVASAGGVEIQLTADNEEDLPVLQKKAGLEESIESPAAQAPTKVGDLYDLSTEILDTDQDVFDMTSEFDFEAAESLLNKKENESIGSE